MAPRGWHFVGSLFGSRGGSNDFVPINDLDAFCGDFLDGGAVRCREVPRGIWICSPRDTDSARYLSWLD